MAKKIKILVVDDETAVAKSIAGALAGKDLAADTAGGGQAALDLDQKNRYPVIITDLMMPGMDGLELLKKIKARRPEALVIMITGFPSVKTAVEAVKLGAFDYIPKPFTPAELRAVVRRALARVSLEGQPQKISGKSLYAIPENTWAKIEDDGNVKIGMHPVFLDTIGHIGEIELPKAGERLAQGEACVKIIDSRERKHRLWCPVGGRVVAVNEKVRYDLKPLVQDPLGQGWLLVIAPDDLESDLKNLVPMED